jgi:hypothetical protein
MLMPKNSALHPRRSSGIVLQDIDITGCSTGAISINATAPKAAAAAGKVLPAPDVLLRNVSITDCSTDESGAGLAVYNSRVVLQGCRLAGNAAGGCGAAVYVEGSSLLLLDSNFTANVGNK